MLPAIPMNVENGISPSRRYRVIMITEDAKHVEKLVILPMSLPNTLATVEVWYQKYIPADHLLLDIEPAEAVEEMPTAKPESEYEGYGDSLDYIGRYRQLDEEPTEEDEEDGLTFVDESDNSPKANL